MPRDGDLPDVSVARFAILLPDTWETLDFDPRTRDRSIETMVRRAVGTADSLVLVRRWAIDTYRQMYSQAAATGLFFGANYAGDVQGRPLSASVLAFVTQSPQNASGKAMDAEGITTALGDPVPSASGDELPLEPPRALDLPVGPSVRTRARVDVRQVGSDGSQPEVDVVRFFTPVAEWGLMLVMAFSTPILAAADAFAELFDAMAGTARWTQ